MKSVLFLAVLIHSNAHAFGNGMMSQQQQQQKQQDDLKAVNPDGMGMGTGLGGMMGGYGMGMGFPGMEAPKPFLTEQNKKISIKTDNDKSISCDLDSISKTYICPNEGHPILVKHSNYGFMAIGKDKDNSVSTPEVKRVEAEDGKVLYETGNYGNFGMGGYGGGNFGTDIGKEYGMKLMAINGFFGVFSMKGTPPQAAVKGSPEFEKLAQMFLEERNVMQEEVTKLYREKNYTVELEDGQKISCDRGEVGNLPEHIRAYEKQLGSKFQCGSFKCSPVKVDGKEYDVTMMYDSTPGGLSLPSLHLMDKEGLGPKKTVKKILSANSKIPVLDNSAMIGNQNFSFYKDAISKMLPSGLKQNRDKIAQYKDPMFEQMVSYNQAICEDDKGLEQILEAKRKLVAKLGELELAEFIQVLGNGSLVGSFVDPSLAPQLGCLYQGVYLDEEAAKNLDRLKKNIHPDKRVEQTISMDRANELFKKAVDMDDIAWKYKPDGCYARAHLMARRFEAEGVRADKVWIKGDLYVPGSNPPIAWNFHVAPIVYVDNGKGQVTKMVIDPSLFSKPVTVEEWDAKMAKRTAKGSVVTAFPFPENAAFMERSALSFSSSDPYLPRDNINMSEEEKMNMADMTMKMYKQMEPK